MMTTPAYSTTNPFSEPTPGPAADGAGVSSAGALYNEAQRLGQELLEKPLAGGGVARVLTQHSKGRMTVW